MFLSPDQQKLFVLLRRDIRNASCPSGHSDAVYCYAHSVGIVDLETLELQVVDHGPGCDFTGLVDTGTASPRFWCGNGVEGRIDSFVVTKDGLRPSQVGEGPDVVRQTSAGLRDIPTRGGQVLNDKHEVVGKLADVPVWVNDVFPLQGDLVLIGVNPAAPSDTLFTELLVVDLSRVAVLRRIAVDPRVRDAAVIDARRLLLLLRDGNRDLLQQVDLLTGDVAQTIQPEGLAGLAVALER